MIDTRETTLLLSPPYTADSEAVWNAALDVGWPVERVEGWRTPEKLRGQDLAYYGFLQPAFAAMLMESLSLALLETPVDWLSRLPLSLRKREVRCLTLGEARLERCPAFIKPARDKSFPAMVYPSGLDLPEGDVLPECLPVLVSEPVSWDVEYRCFVLDSGVGAHSIYSRAGRVSWGQEEPGPASAEAAAALVFIREALAEPHLARPAAFVLDIGQIKGRGWAVVEANPAWASALYGCDAGRVLPVLHRACVHQGKISEADRPWIAERTSRSLPGNVGVP